ncbi:hemerythrin [Chitinophaga parva]|uniref:Hemerythrin n=1 Tax=Chitinophaga parva TaxID=2169414 RepID=A0A2T7BBX4_9BACT|nr:hemerythrin domain-containing protein [Chitinophaga parva]PUZ22596.1 hemerythrin [Chitinophaga parva]
MGSNNELAGSSRQGQSRRVFLEWGFKAAIVPAVVGIGLSASCNNKEDEEDVTPPEDLMREHGVLNRVLLVYDHFLSMLSSGQSMDPGLLSAAAGIIRSFIEDYHEKQEEDYLFPRFEKAHQLTDLVTVLRQQHQAGRTITAQIMLLGKQPQISSEDDRRKLQGLLSSFNRMYRPHEAREDTVLFPALRKIVSKHEFDSLGEDFEKREHQLFGENGFETFVDKVSRIEQQLGIFELAQFTPRV